MFNLESMQSILSAVTFFLAIAVFYCVRLLKDKKLIKYNKKTENVLKKDERIEEDSKQMDVDGNVDLQQDGLVGKLKSTRLREIEANLTRDQLQEERKVEREQLAAIFELLKKQETELNMREIDENELVAQLNLYR